MDIQSFNPLKIGSVCNEFAKGINADINMVSIPLKSGLYVILHDTNMRNDIGFNPLKIGSVCNIFRKS